MKQALAIGDVLRYKGTSRYIVVIKIEIAPRPHSPQKDCYVTVLTSAGILELGIADFGYARLSGASWMDDFLWWHHLERVT
jgi:hypothetical protein